MLKLFNLQKDFNIKTICTQDEIVRSPGSAAHSHCAQPFSSTAKPTSLHPRISAVQA